MIIVVVTDIALLNAKKKQKDNLYRRPKHKEPNKSFIQYIEKDQNLPRKLFKLFIAQGSHSQIAIVIIDHNSLTRIVFAEHHQIDEIHNFCHKLDIAGQILKNISTEITILEQI